MLSSSENSLNVLSEVHGVIKVMVNPFRLSVLSGKQTVSKTKRTRWIYLERLIFYRKIKSEINLVYSAVLDSRS
jgi:hypothetical protein